MGTAFTIGFLALWVLVIFQFLVCLGLMREIRSLRGLPNVDELPIGSALPSFSLRDSRTGVSINSREFLGRAGIILVVSPSCPSCKHLVEALEAEEAPDQFSLFISCSGGGLDCGTFLHQASGRFRTFDSTSADLNQLFGVSGSPFVVVFDDTNRIRGYGHPHSYREILAVFHGATASGLLEHGGKGQAVSASS